MKSASRKSKGRVLQNLFKDMLYKSFPQLREGDIKTAVMGESGEDIKLSPIAQDLIPYSFECKNQERLNIWDSLRQAELNSEDRIPVLVYKRNRSKVYISMEANSFLSIISKEISSTKDYISYVKKFPCLICGSEKVDAHHLDALGMGANRKKENVKDYTCVPLCREHHQEYHTIGLIKFQDKYDIQVWKDAFTLLRGYCELY